jgi:hypothetical protein
LDFLMPENAAPSVRDFHCLRPPCEIENLLIQRLKSSAKIAEVPPLLKRTAAAERGSEFSFPGVRRFKNARQAFALAQKAEYVVRVTPGNRDCW